MIKILELFGGIGACSKALEKIGVEYEIVDYVEIDKYAVASFNAIHDTNFIPQDIKSWNKDIQVDLIMHGSPCQDFSLAGRQAGGDKDSGTRSSLMYETIRIVEKLKPKYVIWENVKNLISKKHIHNFNAYIEALNELGYKSYYKVLNAKDYGIPQNRERVFTVSIRNDITIDNSVKPSVAVNFEREKENIIKSDKEIYQCECESGWQDNKVGLKISPTIRANNNNTFILEDNRYFIFPPKQELKLKLKDLLEKSIDEKYYLTETEKITYSRDFGSKGKEIDIEKEVPTLTASMGTGGGNVPILKVRNNTKKGYLEASPGDGVYTVTSNKRGTVSKDSIHTLTTRQDYGVVLEDLRIRKLTPKECWRLMGFEDKDFEKASKVNSNTQLYKQAGNSIVVNVLEAILKNLL
jgi:DNA (cytosine-5)-methyltransferase 1